MSAGDRPAADVRTLDALTWLAPSVAHELANPLAALVAFSGLLAADPRLPPDLQADGRMLRDEAERTSRLVRTVLELLRDRPPVEAPVDVGAILDEVLELAAPRVAGIELVRVVDEPPPLALADPSTVRRALLVLLVSVLRELGAGTRGATLRVEVARSEDGRVLTAVESRRTTDDEPRRLTLDLPAVADDGTPAGLPEGDADSQSLGPDRLTVVVCDDEDAIRALLVRVLERDGIHAIPAADAPEALSAIEASAVDIVITDHRMAGMTGIELYDRAIEIRPALRERFVVMSGEPGSDELQAFGGRTGVRVVPKPFDVPAIPALVREICRDGAVTERQGQRG